MKCYVSNRPDPQALTVNTFSIAWKDLQFYASRLSASSHKRLVKFSGGKRQRWWQTPSTAFRHLPPNSEHRFPAPSSKKDVVNQYLEFGVSGGGATLANTGLVAAALLTSRLHYIDMCNILTRALIIYRQVHNYIYGNTDLFQLFSVDFEGICLFCFFTQRMKYRVDQVNLA